MAVRQLPDHLINLIAAGEVVERPASVIKELVENAIDAGARQIDIITAKGGKELMRVEDDGIGMAPDELALAICRHTTSKLPDDDLVRIDSLGFRGEALASIGSVARLRIASRARGSDAAFEISVEGGEASEARPVALNQGTQVEVRDLFYATPARLKFLKTDRSESMAVTEVVKRLAMSHPGIGFTLSGPDRSRTVYAAQHDSEGVINRLSQIMGRGFGENSVPVLAGREGLKLTGFVGLPTLTKANSLSQFFFVNGRPVRDKVLLGGVRGAYADFLHRDRYPMLALFLEVDPSEVDVNVHPAKSEVRFRDAGLVRGMIVGTLKQVLAEAGFRASNTVGEATLAAFRPEHVSQNGGGHQGQFGQNYATPFEPGEFARPLDMPVPPVGFNEPQSGFEAATENQGFAPSGRVEPVSVFDEGDESDFPLGAARAQVHENYIIAQTNDGLIIVDQHAAHERIVYERFKAHLAQGDVPAQGHLIPVIVELPEEDCARLEEGAAALNKLGLELDRFGPGAVAVHKTPALLGNVDAQKLVRDIADEMAEWETQSTLEERLHAVASTMACHGSIRSGRRMQAVEMNQLLRDMEATPNSGQCNHGRPTYVELKLPDIERLFGRR